jgi:hypothetical protein
MGAWFASFFQRAAILEIGGDPGRPKGVIAELGFDTGRRDTPADHRVSPPDDMMCSRTVSHPGLKFAERRLGFQQQAIHP